MFQDNRLYCDDDIDVQVSTNSLKAYWTVPTHIQPYTTDAYIAIEKRSGVGSMCSIDLNMKENMAVISLFLYGRDTM